MKKKKKKKSSSKKTVWFEVEINNLEEENDELQNRVKELLKENSGLKEQLRTAEAENQKISELMAARTRELQASRALEHVRITVSEADVMEYARRLNYTLHQTAALIVDSFTFHPKNISLIKKAAKKSRKHFPSPGDLEFLLSSQQTMTIQNVLHSRLGQFCVNTIRAWTFGNTSDPFFAAILNSMKASGKQSPKGNYT